MPTDRTARLLARILADRAALARLRRTFTPTARRYAQAALDDLEAASRHLTAAHGVLNRAPVAPAPTPGPERRYDLRLADGRVVTWPGTSPEDAARRYVDVHREAAVVATRPCQADRSGIYAIPDATRIHIVDGTNARSCYDVLGRDE